MVKITDKDIARHVLGDKELSEKDIENKKRFYSIFKGLIKDKKYLSTTQINKLADSFSEDKLIGMSCLFGATTLNDSDFKEFIKVTLD